MKRDPEDQSTGSASSEAEPVRWADGGGPGAMHEMLASAEQDVLDEDSAKRVYAALAVSGIAAGATVGTVGAKGLLGHLGWIGGGKGLVAFLVAGSICGGVATWSILRGSGDTPVSATRAVASSVAPPSPVVPAPAAAADDTEEEPPLDVDSLRIVDSPSSLTTRAHVAPPPTGPVPPSPSTSVAAPVPSSPPLAPTTAREGLLLLRARAVLDSNPSYARELARQHAREFPDSQLAPERDKLIRAAEERLKH